MISQANQDRRTLVAILTFIVSMTGLIFYWF